MDMSKAVEEFNNKVIGIKRDPGPITEQSEMDWFIGALLEEITEFKEAHESKDFLGEIDALIDLIYFTLGGFTRMGIPSVVVNEIFAAVHDKNMQKVKGRKESRVFTHENDAVKPEGWVSPEEIISNIIDKHIGRKS